MLADETFVHKIIAQIEQKLPSGLKLWKEELLKILKVVIEESLGQLNVVLRSDFEIQQQLLEHTRLKLETLEKQVAALESASGSVTGDSAHNLEDHSPTDPK